MADIARRIRVTQLPGGSVASLGDYATWCSLPCRRSRRGGEGLEPTGGRNGKGSWGRWSRAAGEASLPMTSRIGACKPWARSVSH